MTFKINQSSIGGSVLKEVTQAQGNGFELVDISQSVDRVPSKPRLLSALLGAEGMRTFGNTDSFKYDEKIMGAAIPDGKAYDEKGKRVQKDKPRTIYFEIPSFGLSSNVAPQDYVNRRRPGSANEFLTEDDVVADMNMKSADAWSALDELGMAKLITEGKNLVRGGPFTEYDFYTQITGSAQTTVYVDIANNTDVEQFMRNQRRLITQALGRYSDSANMLVCICGDNFFDERYEVQKNEGLARPIKFGLDLASQPINEDSFGSGTFNYAYFDSQDGIRYINYGSEIIAGSKLIGDDDAYLLPMGANNLIRVAHAPAQTRTYANTTAMNRYSWTYTDEFSGVTKWEESNRLYSLINPLAVQKLNKDAAP